jgi:hypothetical protein
MYLRGASFILDILRPSIFGGEGFLRDIQLSIWLYQVHLWKDRWTTADSSHPLPFLVQDDHFVHPGRGGQETVVRIASRRYIIQCECY